MTGSRIVAVEEVPAESTLLFTVREGGEEVEAFLVRDDGADAGVACWRNHCQHWTDVRLDTGSGAPIRRGQIVCSRHGATFEPDTGYCDFGPCEGAYLEALDVTVEDGAVFLAEADVSFVGLGAAEPAAERSTSPGERLGF